MLLRALAAFLLLPGMVAGVVPVMLLVFDPWKIPGNKSGLLFLFVGLLVLLVCVRDFYVSGKGTLAPWDPPKYLVAVGLYRYNRNPMYVGVLIIIFGWVLFSGSPVLFIYFLIFTAVFHTRVVLFEEKWLAENFTDEWNTYSAAVPRWLFRLSPWQK